MEKAQSLSDNDDFKANINWFKTFRGRHNQLVKEEREKLRESYYEPENRINTERFIKDNLLDEMMGSQELIKGSDPFFTAPLGDIRN